MEDRPDTALRKARWMHPSRLLVLKKFSQHLVIDVMLALPQTAGQPVRCKPSARTPDRLMPSACCDGALQGVGPALVSTFMKQESKNKFRKQVLFRGINTKIADYIELAQAKIKHLMRQATRGLCSLRDNERKSVFAWACAM